MSLPPALIQFVVSLAAILALAWTARRLGLGPAPRIADEADARAALDNAFPGFRPVAMALDADGAGAIARDAAGRVLLLRPHGSHFAGRILGGQARAQVRDEYLEIDTAERRFGTARLRVPDASAWVQAIAGKD